MKRTALAITSVSTLLLGAAAVNVMRCLPRPEKPQKDMVRVACIGDSITFGAGVSKTRKKDAWVYVLERKLGSAYQVINYGFIGATLQREGDLPYRKRGFLKKVKEAEPSVILLMLGTNDSKSYNWDEARFREQYEELVCELLEGTWPHRLVLLAPPKAFSKAKTAKVPYDIDDGLIRGTIRTTVFAIGEKYDLQVGDLYSLTEDHPEYFLDGVHPNKQGNKSIAEYLYGTLSF